MFINCSKKMLFRTVFLQSFTFFSVFGVRVVWGCGEAVVDWWQIACDTVLICFINVKNEVVFLKKAHPDRQTVGVIGKKLLTLQLV